MYIDRVITDHARTVNRICWHPDHAYTLLSGSQDGTMRLWDIRDPNNCKVVFDGKNEPIRDVHFSPFYSNYFAAAFENGNIEIWDIRKNSSYERKLSATHQGPVLCIRWHPEDKNILSSGGRDRFIQVFFHLSKFHFFKTIFLKKKDLGFKYTKTYSLN